MRMREWVFHLMTYLRTKNWGVDWLGCKTWETLVSWTVFCSVWPIQNLWWSSSSMRSTFSTLTKKIHMERGADWQWPLLTFFKICTWRTADMGPHGMWRVGWPVKQSNSKDSLSMTPVRCSLYCWRRCMKIWTLYRRNPMWNKKTVMEDQMKWCRPNIGMASSKEITLSLSNYSMGSWNRGSDA